MWVRSGLAGYQLLTVKEGWRGFVRVSACCLWHVCPGNKPGSIWRKLLSLVLAGWSNKFDIFHAPYFHYNWVGFFFSFNIIILFPNLRIVMKILTLFFFFFSSPQCLSPSASVFQEEKKQRNCWWNIFDVSIRLLSFLGMLIKATKFPWHLEENRFFFVVFSSLNSLPVLADVSCGCSMRWDI